MSRFQPLIDRLALRLGYVPTQALLVAEIDIQTLKEAGANMIKAHREYAEAANNAVAALLYNKDHRELIDTANRKRGVVDAQIIRIEDHRQ